MSDAVKVGFVPFSAASRGVLVLFCDDALKFGAATQKAITSSHNAPSACADFKTSPMNPGATSRPAARDSRSQPITKTASAAMPIRK